MGKKKLQGADGINFQLQLTIKGLEQASFDKKPLKNQSGEEYAWIECLGGKVSAYVNLPSAIRPNNVQPFQLSDCIHLDMISQTVVEYVREYLKDNLQEHYSENILKLLTVSKMECNLTIKCIGKCKPKDVIRLFEKSFTKTTAYKEVGPDGKTYKKPETGITTSKAHEWVLKVYDKTHDQRRLGNLKVEPNLVRVELVFLERMLDRMFANKKSLEDILTRKAIKTLIEQYQATFEDICEKNIKAKSEGLEELPIIPLHGLRHSCATLLNYLEVNIIEISKTLGHSTCSTTMNIYAHSFEEQQEEVATKVNEFLRLNA